MVRLRYFHQLMPLGKSSVQVLHDVLSIPPSPGNILVATMLGIGHQTACRVGPAWQMMSLKSFYLALVSAAAVFLLALDVW